MTYSRDADRIASALVIFARWCRVLFNAPHEWVQGPAYPWCRACGIVQRRDGASKPCKGNPGLSLRAP